MTRPRFSVVIPTRNRPALTKIAVQTVLAQTFDDWELILSDNSLNEDTRAMMAEFDDARIHYHRVDDLSMCDNWEFACEQATGQYVCVLEDKQALKYHALARVNEVLDGQDIQVVRWQYDSLDAYGLGYRIRRNGARGPVHSLRSDACLDILLNDSYMAAKERMPIAHYSAVRRDLLDTIRSGPVGVLFPPMSPDYTLAIQILNFCESITYIDEGLVCFSDTSVSNGLSIRKKSELGFEFAKALGGKQIFYEHVPIKSCLIEGSIVNDYVSMRNQLGGRLAAHPPNWANYFGACHDAIEGSRKLGVDMSAEQTEWERALAEQPDDVQRDVRARVERMSARRNSFGRRVRKSASVLRVTRAAKSMLNGHLLRREDWRFRNIQQYLEHEAQRPRATSRAADSRRVPS